ncbi:methyl-accepting chemotaxis protein (plasmid) [Rhizobium sp. CB3171]|nr:methyl-accepting chemotaxis protein [Rhizobium sp. CB3171]WFU07229.1 methyl-accepting chemotaxis protein [Rhizobium sp. CB3171]
MTSLDKLRTLAAKGIVTILWINVVLIILRELIGNESHGFLMTMAAVTVTAPATLCWYRDPTGATTRMITATTLAATTALLVYSFHGSPLQIDIHMYFFASLAICATWIDWKAIIAYAAFVAVHHLFLYFIAPWAVFPTDSDFSRVILHAVVLITQAAVMVPLTLSLARAFASVKAAIEQAHEAQTTAEAATRRIEETTAEALEQRNAHEEDRRHEASAIQNAVDQLATALMRLSDGDLTLTIESPFISALEKLRLDFNKATAKLRTTMQMVAGSASAITAGAEQIRSAADDLSNRTEQQAASVEQTAAALEEITTTVADSSRRAEEAGQLVHKTRDHAERSGRVVRDAVDAMGKIESSSSEISSIIGVIDEIAFQTNLLALNAGVEAARAGDAGKGFAVVAQEVRELAQRSAKAAKEIKDLINASNAHVKSGVTLVAETGNALREIVTQVQQVSEDVGAIVTGSQEQSTGLKEINAAVNAMDQGTQKNVAMVEESTAASHGLAKEAESLIQLVRQFNIGAATSSPEPRRSVPTAVTTVTPRAGPKAAKSPILQMTAKLVNAFDANAAVARDTWEEF